ncbi:MAG: YebC/PmpR family DNA-binding transcriptional regulator [Ignavibacteriae bacterium]|nr:YebC/PmpR family DNA-binding transcriptional regulator [Ignavibacteriota bacterium]
MSGHNKWAKIKRKKGVNDAKRGRIFTRFIKEMTIAARNGGGNPTGNPRLRLAIEKAQAANMPAENIKRAIQRGTGELPGISYEEVTYEGFGPGGVAIMIESVTDNTNRTVAEVRHLLEKHGGKLGAANSVSRLFHRKGMMTIARESFNEDDVMGIALEAGADDMRTDEDSYQIITSPESFEAVRKALDTKGIKPEEAEVQLLPENTIHLEGKEAEQILKLMESLEDHDDIQHVYANFDIDERIMATFNAE